MADGFLGRWSQRKQAVREGKPLLEPENKAAISPKTAAPGTTPEPTAHRPLPGVPEAEPSNAPALTVQDTEKLTGESDFSPFVKPGVAPEVRNAAVKKLFADPRYNVMDGLDTYIDDYSKPDPLPLSMLKQMASAQFLNLVETPPATAPNHESASTPENVSETTAELASAPDITPPPSIGQPHLPTPNP